MHSKLAQLGILLAAGFVGGATAQAFDTQALAISITSVLFPTNVSPGTGAMWTGVGTGNPQNWNLSDRVFVGNAAYNVPSDRSGSTTTWLPNSASGAQWMPRDSQMVAMATAGNIAITGASRASDGDGVANPPAVIGLSGYAIDDSSNSRGAWAIYGEVSYEPKGGAGSAFALELDAKNKSTNQTTDPYLLRSGAHGIGLGGGGDATYGGAPTNPSNTAIYINSQASTWNQGIVFSSTSLTDGKAISMAQSHRISWYSAFQTISAQMMSGAGSPAGVVSCAARCLYIRTDGAAGSTLYINETGGGTSGWAAK